MIRPRVIPVLLLRGEGLFKGVQFKNYKYVGDPLNAVKIFNDKDVDELIFLDISATNEKRTPDCSIIEKIADECYMPFAFGGGINKIEDIRKILSAGSEKVSINTAAVENPVLIKDAASIFGRQSIVVSIDYRREFGGLFRVYTHSGTRKTKLDPMQWAIQAAELGAGEILLNSIDRDGTMQGYDLNMLARVTKSVHIPVIACGGAGRIDDFRDAVNIAGASAVAAGSMFVFYGTKRAVLISYPDEEDIEKTFT